MFLLVIFSWPSQPSVEFCDFNYSNSHPKENGDKLIFDVCDFMIILFVLSQRRVEEERRNRTKLIMSAYITANQLYNQDIRKTATNMLFPFPVLLFRFFSPLAFVKMRKILISKDFFFIRVDYIKSNERNQNKPNRMRSTISTPFHRISCSKCF